MAENDPAPAAQDAAHVPFDTGCLGCLFLMMVPITVLVGITAFDSELFAIFADSSVRRNLYAGLAPFRTGGVNVAVLLLLVPLVWELVKIARRFVDMKAVWIDGDTIRFHPTLRQQPVPLASLSSVTHDANEVKSILVLRQHDGRTASVAMVDYEAAATFAAEVERLLGERPSA
jgi:hypothetical protein